MKFRSLILAFTLAATAPAFAQSVSPLADVHVRAAVDAARLRYYLAASVDDALTLLSTPEQNILKRALRGEDGANVDPLWSNVIAGSVQMNDVRDHEALIAWWSPIVDGGLATRWRLENGAWRLTQAAPFRGEDLRGELRAVRRAPSWARASEATMGGQLQALAIATRASVSAGQLTRVFTAPSARRDVLSRVYGANASITREAGLPNASSGIGFTHNLLVGSDRNAGAGFVDLDAALREIPTEARLMFLPRAAARRGTHATWLWTTPGAPDRVILATLEDQPDAHPVLTQIAVVDLAGAFNEGAAP